LRLAAAVLAMLAISGPMVSSAAAGSGLQQLESFLDSARSVTASFHQEVLDGSGEVIESSTGRLQLQRPDRFRWDYDDPYERVVMADGERLWLYEADLSQVTIRRLDAGLGETPAALLTGDRRMLERFEVLASWSGEATQWVRLRPRAGDSDFESVAIGFSAGKPTQIEFQDRLGQQTRVRLRDVRLNPSLELSAFRFTVPPGVDVIREDEL